MVEYPSTSPNFQAAVSCIQSRLANSRQILTLFKKSIAEFIETGTLSKYAKLPHAMSIFCDGKCFTLEDVIMSLCNSNFLRGLLRSQKSPRKISNNAYSIRPDTYIVFPLYCMRCSVQANARQRHKLTFRHLQFQQLFTYM